MQGHPNQPAFIQTRVPEAPVDGCSFMIHVRHAAAAIASGLCETVLITHGESGRSGVGRTRNVVAPTADILLLDDLGSCAVHLVLRRGRPVTEQTFDDRVLPPPPAGNSVRLDAVTARTFAVPAPGPSTPVIGIIPGKILTERLQADLPFRGGERHADPARDLLKVCVLERHGRNGNVGRGFVKGFGLERGALASSVGHDSHNICVLDASDEDMAVAVNRLIGLGGGFVAVRDGQVTVELALPIAGLMSGASAEVVRPAIATLRDTVHSMGCPLHGPLLQLSFLPLPVIPHLEITDRGLVDVHRFELIDP